jgi:predicted RNA-binding Zn ribbon-like protein
MAKDQPPPYRLVGGRLCLDFCNTVSDREGTPVERLHEYGDLVGWASRAGILNAEEASRLRRSAARNPTAAVAVLGRALRLREGMHGIFAALAGGRAPRQSQLELLNAELASALSRSQVVATEAGFAWVWSEGGRALDSMLWPIARSAADLLTGGELHAIRECRGEGCGRLFLDTSRNRTRVWCDMKVCGNRAKARRHHERVRAGAA